MRQQILLEKKMLVAGASEDQQANQDWIGVYSAPFTNKRLQTAKKRALELSKDPDVYEVHLVVQGEDDPTFQEFYRNGKLYDKLW